MARTGYLTEKDKYNLSNRLGRRAAKDADLGTILDQAVRVQRISVAYSDLTDGSAVLFGTAIPDNALIKKVWYYVNTTFVGDTDDSSTIKMGLEDQDNDVLVAVAISAGGNPFDAGGHDGVQDGAGANMIKLSAARQLAVTWTSNADSALTAGSMEVYVEWVQDV